jgi:hypothetical protein
MAKEGAMPQNPVNPVHHVKTSEAFYRISGLLYLTHPYSRTPHFHGNDLKAENQ